MQFQPSATFRVKPTNAVKVHTLVPIFNAGSIGFVFNANVIQNNSGGKIKSVFYDRKKYRGQVKSFLLNKTMIPQEVKRIAVSYFQKQNLPIFVNIKNKEVEISSSKDFNEPFESDVKDGLSLTLTPIRVIDDSGNVALGFRAADAISLGKYKGYLTKLLNELYNHLRSDYYFDELILTLDSNENPAAWKNIAKKLGVQLL